MVPDPLKSAMTIGSTEDTSLALPSDATLRTGQARVLNQVHTIKRSKSKQGKHSPCLHPLQVRNSFIIHNRIKPIRVLLALISLYTGFISDRLNEQTESQVLKNSMSLTSSLSSHSGLTSESGTFKFTPFKTNGTVTRSSSAKTTFNKSVITLLFFTFSLLNTAELTLKEAVAFLSHSEENFQQWGATFIQHNTFKDDRIKQEVPRFISLMTYLISYVASRWCPPLVGLLRSANPGVSQAAAGALRNLVFKNQANKQKVLDCEGIGKALDLLKETDSTETQKQVTGLLWNMSSTDELKSELITKALPVLTENVIVPFTCWSDNTANNIHPEVFYNATGCLRNLSCAQKKERDAMRTCPGLIDSLVSYTQSCIAEENPDDKSVENSTCILHNLTYQLEAEAQECFSNYYPPESATNKSPTTTGCFSPKSSKAQKEFTYDRKPDRAPTGVMWLSHPKTMQTYLSLLGSSQKDGTLEACCGALQNLTASRGLVSTILQILVQKLGVLQYMVPLLKSTNHNLQKTAISLLSNLSKSSWLQSSMGKGDLMDIQMQYDIQVLIFIYFF
uniref:Plakophilin 1 n=1 Tax=Neogobius melanostomus TaxID=47308 RepID=A0A8C6WKV5_9GOBI